MDRQYVIENARELTRLRNLVSSLAAKELSLPLYREGWTVAVALAHLAFWDQRRLLLIRLWREKGVEPVPIDTNTTNDALLPFLLAIPPRKAAAMAVSIATELDRELETLPPGFITALEKLQDRHALNRAVHRQTHLDDIEKLLGRQGKK